MNERLSGMRAVLISETNYELLNQFYSFDDYDVFYKKTFDPYPTEEEVPIDGSTLDEPLLNLPPVDETTPAEEDDGEEIQQSPAPTTFRRRFPALPARGGATGGASRTGRCDRR